MRLTEINLEGMTMTRTMIGSSVLALTLFVSGSIVSAQDSTSQLVALAREARTANEHADVAKRFRMHADALDLEAARHEVQAEKLAKNAPSVVHKWPAMAPKELTQAKQQAAEARRAARESREQAARHQSLAVEALPAQQ